MGGKNVRTPSIETIIRLDIEAMDSRAIKNGNRMEVSRDQETRDTTISRTRELHTTMKDRLMQDNRLVKSIMAIDRLSSKALIAREVIIGAASRSFVSTFSAV